MPAPLLGKRTVTFDTEIKWTPTRQLATWIYVTCPDVQGLAWTSRQDDSAQAIVLFEPRLVGGTLTVVEQDADFFSGPHHAALIDLVARLGASLIIVP